MNHMRIFTHFLHFHFHSIFWNVAAYILDMISQSTLAVMKSVVVVGLSFMVRCKQRFCFKLVPHGHGCKMLFNAHVRRYVMDREKQKIVT